jgi:hypothetical protein
MSREMRAKAKPKTVAINTIPLWLVDVMTVSGGDCPGRRPVPFEDMARVLGEHWRKMYKWERRYQQAAQKFEGYGYTWEAMSCDICPKYPSIPE